MIDARVEVGPDGLKKISNEDIISHSITFLLGGYETSANTLTFIAYLLALHPDIQKRLQEEIDEYFSDNPVRFKLINILYFLDHNPRVIFVSAFQIADCIRGQVVFMGDFYLLG